VIECFFHEIQSHKSTISYETIARKSYDVLEKHIMPFPNVTNPMNLQLWVVSRSLGAKPHLMGENIASQTQMSLSSYYILYTKECKWDWKEM